MRRLTHDRMSTYDVLTMRQRHIKRFMLFNVNKLPNILHYHLGILKYSSRTQNHNLIAPKDFCECLQLFDISTFSKKSRISIECLIHGLYFMKLLA